MSENEQVLSRFYAALVDEIRAQRPDYLTGPFTVAEIYQNLVPYGLHRDRIGVEMNGDYEDALLRLLAGEGGYLVLESEAALRRAARDCNGWLGLHHDLESAAEPIARLESLRRDFGRDTEPFEIIVGATISEPDDVKRWEDAGVTRIIASPWRRSKEAIEGLRRHAELVLGG